MARQRNTTFAASGLAALLGRAGCASDDATDRQPISAEALRAALTGNTFDAFVTHPRGSGTAIVHYGADGVVKARVSFWAGPDEGTWDIEGGDKICVKYRVDRNGTRNCNVVRRLSGDQMTYSSPEGATVDGTLLKGNPFGL